MKASAVIVAAGTSERFGGGVPKQFQQLNGRPLLSWTVARFEAAACIEKIILVIGEEHLLYAGRSVVDPYNLVKVAKIVPGGVTRQESVLRGLKALPASTRLVAIHDGARPLVSPHDICRVVELAATERAATLAVPAADTVKRVRDGFVINTLERNSLYLAQTPQAFQYDLIMVAHGEADDRTSATDDASLVEARGFKVQIIEPTRPNIKVTTSDDMIMVEALLREESNG